MIHVSRRAMAVGVAATTAVAVGLFTVSSNAGESRYRTVVAAQGDVEQTVTFDGTIAASNRSDLVFATAGTVLKVRAEVGDEVEAGDVLATLDATDLETAVTQAKADLADAEAYLDDVEDGQIDTVKRAGGGTVSAASVSSSGTVTSAVHVVSAGTTTTTAVATSDELTAKLAELTAQQEAVKNAQSGATSAITDARSALTAQQQACEDEPAADAEDEDVTAESGLSQGCRDALQAVQAAQDVVAEKQDALQSALGSLGDTLNAAVTQLEKDSANSGPEDTTEPTPDTGTDTGTRTDGKNENQTEKAAPKQSERDTPSGGGQSGQTPGGSGSASGSSGTTATAADLASAQADVDAARAALAETEADLGAATLTAPFGGTVMAADVAAGDAVSTSDRAFVLIGDGDNTATLSVPVDDLSGIEVGQAARITPGAAATVEGEVSSIGLTPEDSDDQSSSTTYQVTVRIDGDIAAPEGSTASVALVTGTATGVVTLPTSAVTRRTATQGTVMVLGDDGEVSRGQVTLGAMSGTSIAVTDGITAGQRVVVADLEAALPSSDTATVRSLTGGGTGGPPRGGGPSGGGGTRSR